ncbi:GNAT family N-acetyltransferase [Vagococcus zengguangii]|uniref:N-acetyltransferase n=1 Tax=Vagococcus zengguangii TaxID=2571750 RepID=A0A4D7CUL0_9ENTE|nr:GNAT family N-acetyltransferase [Vagococcus zengguangii]QCI86934.1 N-acetyltransferase [Vagococcus zengguangii]TLG81024.1 N-acetyltransferase [Vagococcus zengguangii]
MITEHTNGFIMTDETGQKMGEITFSIAGDTRLIIDHTFVDPAFRGQKIGDQLVNQVVLKARAEGKKIIPLCPFAKRQFQQHLEYQDVHQQ